MADDAGGPLPPGWDRKFDHRSGRYYFINYFNKTTTWEDPRSRYRQLNQVTPQHVPAPTMVENIPLQDMPAVRPSPIPGRMAVAMGSARGSPFSSPARSTSAVMESSLITETDIAAAKIGAMFPTVSDSHIRNLLMKYLKSVFPKVEETLLLDILSNSDNNVQKATEKLQTMGFEKRDTPPPRLTLRGKSEESTASQPRPSAQPTPPPRMKSVEEKQKMKLRLQDRHTDVPERVIGIALESVDYDEERASQILLFMVQEEQRMQMASSQQRSGSGDSKSIVEVKESEGKPSADASAGASRKSESPAHKVAADKSSPAHKASAQKTSESISTHFKRPKNKKDVLKMSRGTCTAEDAEYRSPYLTKATGPNPDLRRGANDDLLLADYVTWSGPNPDLLQTPSPRSSLAKGPDPTLLGERTYKAKGPNADLCKGPLRGLAKGSMYSRLTASTGIPLSEESRGK